MLRRDFRVPVFYTIFLDLRQRKGGETDEIQEETSGN
jgi:hypothetical protein|nr:MAG TPA: hypothetical protein [Caudoviricetes sp.]